MKRIFILSFLALTAQYAGAQWNTDTDINLEVSALQAADQHTASTKDGKTWIAYYAPVNGNYHMRAQLLDKDGNKLLGEDGVVVNDNPSGSSISVFNICLDTADNLIVAAQDQRTGESNATMYKIDQGGKSLWNGGRGVILGAGLSPFPAVMSDGDVVAAWSDKDNKLSLNKISPDGKLKWNKAKQVSYGKAVARCGQIVPLSDSGFVMIYQSSAGRGIVSTPFAQRFDRNGDSIWAKSVQLSPTTNTTSIIRYYSIAQDADTIYYGFFSSSLTRFSSVLQRINPDGNLPYGAAGIPFSDYSASPDPMQMETHIALDPNSPYVWAVCNFTTPGQTDYGVYVQKFRKDNGAKMLGPFGKEVYPVAPTRYQHAGNLSLKNDAPVFMVYEDKNYLIKATLLDTSGNFYIPGNAVTLSSTLIQQPSALYKGRLNFTEIAGGQCVAVWTEDRGNGYQSYAQNFDMNVYDTSIAVSTDDDVAAVINVFGGSLQLNAAVMPQTASQDVTWEIIPGTGKATILASGLVTAVEDGDGTVWAKATSVAAPSYADSIEIKITNQEKLSINNVPGSVNVKVYPNPVGDVFYVASASAHVPLQLRIVDISGRVIHEEPVAANALSRPFAVNAQQMAPGIYLLELKGEGVNLSFKLGKQ